MKKRRFLVVEDDGVIQLYIEQILSDLEFEIVAISGDGEEAISLAIQYCPDYILMDVGIPGAVDGINAARQIIEKIETKIIFITGNSDKGTIERAKQIKPYSVIYKPFSEDRLKQELNTLVLGVSSTDPSTLQS